MFVKKKYFINIYILVYARMVSFSEWLISLLHYINDKDILSDDSATRMKDCHEQCMVTGKKIPTGKTFFLNLKGSAIG